MLLAALRGQGLCGAGDVRRATAAVACASSFSSSSCWASSDTRSSCFFRSSYLQGSMMNPFAGARAVQQVRLPCACIQSQKLTTAFLTPTLKCDKHCSVPFAQACWKATRAVRCTTTRVQRPGRIADAGIQQVNYCAGLVQMPTAASSMLPYQELPLSESGRGVGRGLTWS